MVLQLQCCICVLIWRALVHVLGLPSHFTCTALLHFLSCLITFGCLLACQMYV